MYLCKRGYCIKKSDLDPQTLFNLKKKTRAIPLVDTKYSTKDTSYPIYNETNANIYLPKMLGISQFGLPISLKSYNGKTWDEPLEFTGELYDYQQEAVKCLIDACTSIGGGILSLNTGQGKTFCALYTLSKLKGKTLVIVNKISLMNQWKMEISQFLPGAKVGIIQGQKYDIDGCHIVISMLQSLSRIDYPQELFADFNTLVVDECHKISSKVFSQVMFKLCSKYTIGLTATPTRSDNCECVFKWHIGNVVYRSSSIQNGLPLVIINNTLVSEKYKEAISEKGIVQFSTMISSLVNMKSRNDYIVSMIQDICSDPQRKLLVMSERREHVETLYNLLELDTSKKFSVGVFMGGMKDSDLKTARTMDVILATFASFGEGVSEKDLNCMILATPKKYITDKNTTGKKDSGSMTQICGRILRKKHTENHPVIIDLQDDFSVYRNQSRSRRTFYNKSFPKAIIRNVTSMLDSTCVNFASNLLGDQCLIED